VWTPKRILLLVLGFFGFALVYYAYSQILGGIDGLPALPADYQITQSDNEITQPLPPRENSAQAKLRMAFGVDCDEAKNRNIQLEIDSKHMVLAAGEMAIVEGRVKLWPFSLAIFGKDKGDNQFPEINTLKSEVAFLTFDEKIKNIVDMNGRRIVAAELHGEIHVVNNRRRAQRDNDLSLFTQGPLYYDESQHLINTKNDTPVRMIDQASKPNPHTIVGEGLSIELKSNEKSPPAVASPGGKNKGGMTTDVERIRLGRNVDMNLWVDAQSGFLGSGKPGAAPIKPGGNPKTPAPVAVGTQDEKANVIISTQGPFTYDLRTNVATFDISKTAGAHPNVITVDRLNLREGKHDHMQCDHLEILFHRKNEATQTAGSAAQAEGLDIEHARATGKEVVLTSDAEFLEAHGNDFFYDKLKQVSILKGSPHMWALKEGNEIEAPALEMHQQKGAEEAIAIGAGRIRMLDKKTGKRPVEARWKERLNYQKESQQDILTLRGDAVFIDDEHKQQLAADTLKVWLLPPDGTAPKDTKDGEQPQRKPKKLDAQGHVTVTGPDMNLHDADQFVVHFKDVPPSEGQLPPPQPAAPSAVKSEASGTPGAAGPKVLPPADPKKPGAPAETPKSKKPMDLTARAVTAFVKRIGERNEIDQLWCEGTVRVKQEPETPEDRGVDIRGDTLKLNHHVDGNVLVVTGEHAQVQINKICILGPEVNIDQTSNEVWVTGMGIMRMLSKSNFDGKELQKPTELIVSWDNRMYFDGQAAKFRGNVQGEQDTGHLAGPWMDVTLDHRISLKEGEKSGPPAKVQKLIIGDKRVWMEDVKQEKKKVIASKRIDCLLMSVDNDPVDQETQMEATGPGVVRIFQQGGQDELVSAPSSAKAPAKTVSKPKGKEQAQGDQQPKLTQVTFEGKMVANNKRNTSSFYDKVEMINIPTDNPDFKFKEGRLPPGYFYLTCEQLDVMSRKVGENTVKEMRAQRNVSIEGPEYSGHAETVKYDESKEQIILEGSSGNPAVLYRERVKGSNADVLRGKQIIYWRLTGLSSVDGAREVHMSK
jgi:lipopolysaccharide export system protein LptA